MQLLNMSKALADFNNYKSVSCKAGSCCQTKLPGNDAVQQHLQVSKEAPSSVAPCRSTRGQQVALLTQPSMDSHHINLLQLC